MRIKIIKHETDFFSMGIMLINECLYKVSPVNFCVLISHLCVALTR